MNEPSSPSIQSTTSLRALQEILHNWTYIRKEKYISVIIKPVYTDSLWTEIEAIQWVLAQILTLTIIMKLQQEQQQHQQRFVFGQIPEEWVVGEQTFRSAFDTFVSSEPGGYGIYETGNLMY